MEYSIVWASRTPRAPGVRAIADGIPVPAITPSLDPAGRGTGNPHRLAANRGFAFQGSIVLGLGFTMTEAAALALIDREPRNADVLFPYVNGEDLNSRPDSSGSRWIVNFGEMSEAHARRYAEPWAWIEERVRPERMTKDGTKYPRMVDEWWKYWNARPALHVAIEGLSHVLAITRHSKNVMPVRVPTGQVVSEACVVFATDDMAHLALLSSAPHYWWTIAYASTIGAAARYTPSDVFETLPRPEPTERMRAAGQALDRDRRAFMLGRQLGLTKTYNLVHDPAVTDAEVAHLRALHVAIDEAVCAAYGWDDLPLGHGHHDTRQGVRWTVAPAVQVELLDRLLELNFARHAAEQPAGQRGTAGGRRTGSVGPTGQDGQDSLFDDREDR